MAILLILLYMKKSRKDINFFLVKATSTTRNLSKMCSLFGSTSPITYLCYSQQGRRPAFKRSLTPSDSLLPFLLFASSFILSDASSSPFCTRTAARLFKVLIRSPAVFQNSTSILKIFYKSEVSQNPKILPCVIPLIVLKKYLFFGGLGR